MDILQCPKCGYSRQALDHKIHKDICPSCGIVYRKWLTQNNGEEGFSLTHADSPMMRHALPTGSTKSLHGKHLRSKELYKKDGALNSKLTTLGIATSCAVILLLLYLA